MLQFYHPLTPPLQNINHNSLILHLTIIHNFNQLHLPQNTLINHNPYKILHQQP
ncbi:DUF2187 family protein [Staphylococcus epidermidis]|uniref:DUF2187 family protein n=1 Tax=Staphylococcus epidermidis TaxID=1282 RepID=UPI0037D9E668